MKANCTHLRFLNWMASAFFALVACQTAQAQLTPIWTINHGQAVPAAMVRGEIYDNLGFFGVPIVQERPAIDFNWGFQSPAPGIPPDSFTARWTGRIMPTRSDTYSFLVTAAGGARVWLDDQLILDFWFEHAESELASAALYLTAGSVHTLRVDYFETTGVASIRVQWQSVNLPKQLVRFQDSPDGTEAGFGAVLAGVGNGRFVVGAPEAETLINSSSNIYVREGGNAWFYDQSGQNMGSPAGPSNLLRHNYGTALATFPDGRVLVGSANSAMSPGKTNTTVGSVYLHGRMAPCWVNGSTRQARQMNTDPSAIRWPHFLETVLPPVREQVVAGFTFLTRLNRGHR
jgi:hypothetical protein